MRNCALLYVVLLASGCNAYRPVEAQLVPLGIRDAVSARYPGASLEHVEWRQIGDINQSLYWHEWRGLVIDGREIKAQFEATPNSVKLFSRKGR